MTAKQSVEPDTQIPRGGVWENQILYGGKKMREEFAAAEPFILWGLADAGEVPVDEGTTGKKKMVPKTTLIVSRLAEPDEKFEVGTLSSAIHAMLERDQQAGDFPVECYWEDVDTKLGLNPATVLTAVRRWQDPAGD